jgi:hypothetical protein
MARPKNKPRSRVRVEFSLPPDLAAAVYSYAEAVYASLSQAGADLLKYALGQGRTGQISS